MTLAHAYALVGIPADDLDAAWPDVSPWITKACERSHGRMRPEDWYEGIKERTYQLWVMGGNAGIDAVFITEIRSYPRRRYAHVHIGIGRNMRRWLHLIDEFERLSRDYGLDGIEGNWRPGWERVLASKGYRKTHVFMEKVLD